MHLNLRIYQSKTPLKMDYYCRFLVFDYIVLYVTDFVTIATRRVPLVEQELLTLSEHPFFTSGFQWCSCCSIFSFLCSVLQIVVYPVSVGHCIVCPMIYSDYPSNIFWYLQTLLLHINIITIGMDSIALSDNSSSSTMGYF